MIKFDRGVHFFDDSVLSDLDIKNLDVKVEELGRQVEQESCLTDHLELFHHLDLNLRLVCRLKLPDFKPKDVRNLLIIMGMHPQIALSDGIINPLFSLFLVNDH